MARSLQCLHKGVILLNCSKLDTFRFVHHKRWLSLSIANCSSYIPLSSKTLFKKLINEKQNLTEDALRNFEQFAGRADATISTQNINFIPTLKTIYDPLNPDFKISASKTLKESEIQDREFWFLQRCSSHLEKTGFCEVNGEFLKKYLDLRPVGQGVLADLRPENFDLLRFWVLSDVAIDDQSFWKPINSTLGYIFGDSPSKNIFKQVVVACRLKDSDKLFLKLFKDIPSNRLHLLIPPSSGLRMHESYFKLLYGTTGLSALFLLSRPAVTWLVGSGHHLGLVPVGFSAFFGLTAVGLWTNYKQRQKRYLCDVLDVFNDRFIAANQNLLNVLCDKVHEEILKGVMITYFFLISAKNSDKEGIFPNTLERDINAWLKLQTGQKTNFSARSSLEWLSQLGIIDWDGSDDGAILPMTSSEALKILSISGNDFIVPLIALQAEHHCDDDVAPPKKQDFMDKISYVVWKQLNRFKNTA